MWILILLLNSLRGSTVLFIRVSHRTSASSKRRAQAHNPRHAKYRIPDHPKQNGGSELGYLLQVRKPGIINEFVSNAYTNACVARIRDVIPDKIVQTEIVLLLMMIIKSVFESINSCDSFYLYVAAFDIIKTRTKNKAQLQSVHKWLYLILISCSDANRAKQSKFAKFSNATERRTVRYHSAPSLS